MYDVLLYNSLLYLQLLLALLMTDRKVCGVLQRLKEISSHVMILLTSRENMSS